jgi:putative hydrolase of the HAD superfamily
MPLVRGVLFDAAGTLLDLRPPLAERAAETVRSWGVEVDVEAAVRSLATRRDWPPDTPDPELRRARWTAFCASVLRALVPAPSRRACEGSIDLAAQRLAGETLDPRNYALYPDAVACLAALAARGVPVGIVSNFDVWLLDVVEALQLADAFACVVLSSVEGCCKPDPRLFAAGAERLGVDPAEILFVGDSPRADVEGARAFGMQAVLIDRVEAFPDVPHARIADLAGVVDLLDRAG